MSGPGATVTEEAVCGGAARPRPLSMEEIVVLVDERDRQRGTALKLAAPVVIALLLTVLLVYLIDPVVVLLVRRRMPLWLAAFLSVLLFALVFAGFGLLIFLDLPHFARSFPRFQEEILARAQGIVEGIERSLGVSFVFDPFVELRSAPLRPLLMSLTRSSLRFISEFIIIFFCFWIVIGR